MCPFAPGERERFSWSADPFPGRMSTTDRRSIWLASGCSQGSMMLPRRSTRIWEVPAIELRLLEQFHNQLHPRQQCAAPPAIQVDLLPGPPAREVDGGLIVTTSPLPFLERWPSCQVPRPNSRLSKEARVKVIPSITTAKQGKDNRVGARVQERG